MTAFFKKFFSNHEFICNGWCWHFEVVFEKFWLFGRCAVVADGGVWAVLAITAKHFDPVRQTRHLHSPLDLNLLVVQVEHSLGLFI